MTEAGNGVMSTPEEVRQAVHDALEQMDTRNREEKAREDAVADRKAQLTNRVSIAAICLTMLMSFLGFARAERAEASGGASQEAARAKTDAEANWAYYLTRAAQRTGYAVADDTLTRDTASLPDADPRVQMAAVHHAEYRSAITAIEASDQGVFFVVQDLARKQVAAGRRAARINRTTARYDMGTRVLTLAVVLLSVTLLANRAYLFWVGVGVALVGAGIAVTGYFLLF